MHDLGLLELPKEFAVTRIYAVFFTSCYIGSCEPVIWMWVFIWSVKKGRISGLDEWWWLSFDIIRDIDNCTWKLFIRIYALLFIELLFFWFLWYCNFVIYIYRDSLLRSFFKFVKAATAQKFSVIQMCVWTVIYLFYIGNFLFVVRRCLLTWKFHGSSLVTLKGGLC